jgi:hypothetical protein
MSLKIETMIARAVSVPGYTNPVAYDETQKLTNGSWICKACKSGFYGNGNPMHTIDCSLKARVNTYIDEEMIYVLGPNENGSCAPYKKEDIERIKELAKSHLESQGSCIIL